MRRKNDLYETPPWMVQKLLKHYNVQGMILEPCNGNGNISSVLWKTHLDEDTSMMIFTNDIDVTKYAGTHLDACEATSYYGIEHFDWEISNPPFNCAYEIIQKAIELADKVAMILRLSFLEPTYERAEFLAQHPPHTMIVMKRYSFTGNGKSDTVTTAWMLWGNCEHKGIIVEPDKED